MQCQLSSTAGAGMVSKALLQSGCSPASGLEPWVVRMKHCLFDHLATSPPTMQEKSTFCTPTVFVAFMFVLNNMRMQILCCWQKSKMGLFEFHSISEIC